MLRRMRMEAVMRIRRNILAPAILTVGTIGSLVAGPVLPLRPLPRRPQLRSPSHAMPDAIVMHG